MVQKDTDVDERIRESFKEMGVSVFSGMFTSVGASIFLFMCQIQFFFKFGKFEKVIERIDMPQGNVLGGLSSLSLTFRRLSPPRVRLLPLRHHCFQLAFCELFFPDPGEDIRHRSSAD